MKLSIITFFVLIGFQLAFAQSVEDKNTGSLTIVVTGFENDDGELLSALSNSRENYESNDSAFVGVSVKIENKKAEYTFEELPFGEYAIKLFHDENMDGITDFLTMLVVRSVRLITMMQNFFLSRPK